MKGRSIGIFSLPTQITMPVIPNEEKYDSEWRKAIQEDLPVYFNADGTRSINALRSRSHSKFRAVSPNSVGITPR